MPRIEEFQIRPLGWETDPEEERFKLSTIDYSTTTTWTNNAVFFRLEDSEREKAIAILKDGLARTLSQVRHLVGTVERDSDGHHSIVRKKGTTVKFVVQHLDGPGDRFPSFSEIEKAHYLSPVFGDMGIDVVSNAPMTCGNKPEAHPDNSPVIASYKANFVRGGLIFIHHNHHYANGLFGTTSFIKQLAGNCYAVANSTEFPSFDPSSLDRSRFGALGFDRPSENEELVEAPPRLERNSEHRPSQFIMFHLPKSRAAELKKAASPTDGSPISTFDALCALMWRVMCRIRQPLYKHSLDSKPIWAQGVSIGKLFTNPPMPSQMQGNMQVDVVSTESPTPQLNLAEIISEAPLSRLAQFTRQMTNIVTIEMLAERFRKSGLVRNKQDLSINLDSFPPMALLVSDWRHAAWAAFDYGFGKGTAQRHLFGGVPLCQVVIYPPREGPRGSDEGMEIMLTVENELVEQLVHDQEWSRYFEYRGVEAEEEAAPPKAKL